jgi:hypothetical protein
MHVIGDITYQQVRHAYIMLSLRAAVQGGGKPPYIVDGDCLPRRKAHSRLTCTSANARCCASGGVQMS